MPAPSEQERMEEGAAQLLNAIINAKAMAARGIILELFEPDMSTKVFRLRGIGGPQGIVSLQTMDEILNRVIMEGLIRDAGNSDAERPGSGESLARDDDDGTPRQGEAPSTS